MRTLKKIALVTLFVTSTSLLIYRVEMASTVHAASSSAANIVSVEGSSKELVQGYFAWLHRHPQVMLGSGSGSAQQGAKGESYKILWPYLDIYDSDGRLIYHGSESGGNIQVIQGLPMRVPANNVSPNAPLRPTFSEAINMFHELPTTIAASTSNIHYTVYVISHGDRPACKPQDQAIAALERRIDGSDLRLVEVHIKAGN